MHQKQKEVENQFCIPYSTFEGRHQDFFKGTKSVLAILQCVCEQNQRSVSILCTALKREHQNRKSARHACKVNENQREERSEKEQNLKN